MSMLRINDKIAIFSPFIKVLFTRTEMSMLRIDDKIAMFSPLIKVASRRMFRSAATLLVASQRSSVHCFPLSLLRNGWPLRGAWPLPAPGPPTSEELRSRISHRVGSNCRMFEMSKLTNANSISPYHHTFGTVLVRKKVSVSE